MWCNRHPVYTEVFVHVLGNFRDLHLNSKVDHSLSSFQLALPINNFIENNNNINNISSSSSNHQPNEATAVMVGPRLVASHSFIEYCYQTRTAVWIQNYSTLIASPVDLTKHFWIEVQLMAELRLVAMSTYEKQREGRYFVTSISDSPPPPPPSSHLTCIISQWRMAGQNFKKKILFFKFLYFWMIFPQNWIDFHQP